MRLRFLSIISLVIGIALFLYLLKQSGTAEILARVRALGWGFLLILIISALRQCARAFAWLRCMSDDARSVGFFAVLRARLAGDALADLTAAGPVVGEPIKLAKLKGKLSLTELAASLAVENLAYAVSCALMILTGTLSLLTFFALGDSLRTASLATIAFIFFALLSLILMVRQRWRILSSLVARIFSPSKVERVRELENYLFFFFAQRPRDFFVVALCHFIFHAMGVLEIFVTMYLLGFHTSMLTAFILEATNRALNIAFAFVPAMVGVDEAGTGLLTTTLGLGATAGVTLALVRKARVFFWMGLGLMFLLHRKERTANQEKL